MQSGTTRGSRGPSLTAVIRRQRGFTMTELALGVAIAAILTTLAVPSFNGLIANKRAQTLASALYVTLAKTRSEALTLNNNVTLQAKAGGWASGWQMLDPAGRVLEDYTAATGVTIAGPAPVVYRSSGRLTAGAAAPVFRISTTSGSSVYHQCVSVDLGGRPYMADTPTC
jgi:type IV fimbrial biogenesis protein FimT